jgi:hypothetical protein
MNDKLREFEKVSGLEIYGLGAKRLPWEHTLEKFAELIIKECIKLNKHQSYELMGVITDVEEGDGFDDVCLDTVKRVAHHLDNDLKEHFEIE